MKPYDKIPREDWEAMRRICEYYQYEMRGLSLEFLVDLPMVSSDPSQPAVRVKIGRAKVLVRTDSTISGWTTLFSRRHMPEENEREE